jgi:hypothetical protein
LAYLELIEVNLVHSLSTEESVKFCLSTDRLFQKSAFDLFRKGFCETSVFEFGPCDEEGRDEESANGSGKGSGEGVNIGRREVGRSEMGKGGEEDGGSRWGSRRRREG